MSRHSHKRIVAAVSCLAVLGLFAGRTKAQIPESILAKLQKRITLEKGIAAGTEFGDAIRRLEQISGARIALDKKAFETEASVEVIEDQSVQLPALKNVELEAVLRALLPQVEAIYEIRPEGLVIAPAKERNWPALPITPERASAEAEVSRRLKERVTLPKALVADNAEDVVAILNNRFGVQIVSQLPYMVHQVRLEAANDVPLTAVLDRLFDERIDRGRFRYTREIQDRLVILSIQPICLAGLLGPPPSPVQGRQTALRPAELEKEIQAILAAKDLATTAESYRALFRKIGVAGIPELQAHTNDGVALRAAWEEVALTVPEKAPDRTARPDSYKLAWFVGFVEGRIHGTVPQWWREAVLDSRADHRAFIYPGQPTKDPYHKSGLDSTQCPRDTTVTRESGKIVLRQGKESIVISEAVVPKSDAGDAWCNFSALFKPVRCYVAVHGHSGYGFDLMCIDRSSGKISWKSGVFGTWWGAASGGAMWVSVIEQNGRIIVFGASSTGIHVEAFRSDDGKNLFRFSSREVVWKVNP